MRLTLCVLSTFAGPVDATLAWRMGQKLYVESVFECYCQEAEYRLLESNDRIRKGYKLFRVASLGGSMGDGWYRPLSESNSMTVQR